MPVARSKIARAQKVDHDLVAPVMPGDQAGQHPGIGGGGAGVDDRQPHPRQRGHRKGAQDQRMGMTAAHKDQILDRRIRHGLHHRPFRWPPS
jgi:hypothetical protein